MSGKYWDKSWSLVDGCTPVSEGCEHCWSAAIQKRFLGDHSENPLSLVDQQGLYDGVIRIRKDRLNIPLKTRKPTIFSIWNDLFHEQVSAEFIIKTFEVMEHCKQHTFLILTKRPERINPVLFGQEGNFYLGGGDYMPNVWLGTTVENQEMADKRIPLLIRGADSFKRFLSFEPMLGEINNQYLHTNDIHQVIVGAETGHHARPCKPDWIRSLRNQCEQANISLFVKNIGKQYKKDMSDWPDDLKIRKLMWKEELCT